MSAQGAGGAAAEVISDDAFSAEEAQQFEQMQRETEAPVPGQGDPPAPVVDPDPAAVVDPALAAEDDDDDEAAAAPQPGQQTGRQQLGPDGKPMPRRVNFGKYARMEERAKRAETELTQVKEMFTRTDERLKLLNDALTAGQRAKADDQREEDPEPDPENDIFGWVKWAQRDRARMQDLMTQNTQRQQSQAEESTVQEAYTTDAQQFIQREPAFAGAYEFLMKSRAVELAQYYFGKDLFAGEQLTPQELIQVRRGIAAEERELVTMAMKNRQSPAQRIFALAKARGFKPQAPAAGAGAVAAGGSGAGGAPAPAAPQVPSVAAEIDRIQRGTRQPSLSQGGGAPPNPLTPEKLANMPQDEFERMLESMTETQQRAFFGT